ncbi:hypothetical protein JGC36_10335 [Erwinia amylovora]|nr:hypothetical protein JGC36_10335 [Erwinia amylovora]
MAQYEVIIIGFDITSGIHFLFLTAGRGTIIFPCIAEHLIQWKYILIDIKQNQKDHQIKPITPGFIQLVFNKLNELFRQHVSEHGLIIRLHRPFADIYLRGEPCNKTFQTVIGIVSPQNEGRIRVRCVSISAKFMLKVKLTAQSENGRLKDGQWRPGLIGPW